MLWGDNLRGSIIWCYTLRSDRDGDNILGDDSLRSNTHGVKPQEVISLGMVSLVLIAFGNNSLGDDTLGNDTLIMIYQSKAKED